MHVRRPRMSLDHCRQSFGTFSAVDCVLLQRVVRRARLHYSSCHYWVRKRASISKPSSPIRISSTPSKSQALDLFKDFEFPFSVFRLQSHTGSTKFLHLDDFSFPDFVKHMNHHSSMLCCWILLLASSETDHLQHDTAVTRNGIAITGPAMENPTEKKTTWLVNGSF